MSLKTFLLPKVAKTVFALAKQPSQMKYKAMMVFPAIILGIGITFGLIALHDYLARLYGSLTTHLIFAGGFVALALVGFGYLSFKIRAIHHRSRAQAIQQNLTTNLADTFGTDSEFIEEKANYVIRHHGKKVLAGVIFLGLLLGRLSK